MKTPAQLMRALLSSAVIASGLTVVAVAGPVSPASATQAFTVDEDSVVTVHGQVSIAGSNSPRVVAGNGTVTTLTLANTGWLPRGGALAPDGTLYLQDASVVPTRVVKIAPDGTESVVATLDFPAAGQLAPTTGDVTMLPDGDLVVSAYRSPNTRFTRVNPTTGAATTLFTLTNSESAARTGADGAGNFYYFSALTSPKQVWKVSPTVGATPTLVGGTGTFGFDMNVDGVGNVYVAGGVGVGQANHGEINKFTLQGDGSYSAATLWASTPTVAQGGYSSDAGITATPNGQVVLARHDGTGNGALYRFSSAGTLVATQTMTGTVPQVITSLPSSNPFTNAVDASISGTVKVGTSLTGSAGTYAPSDATIAYAWKVGSDTVGTTSSYTPKLADAGKSLTLTVTGTKAGYAPSTSTTTGQTVATVQGFTGTVQAGQTLTASDSSGTSTWGLSASSSCTSPTTSTGTTFELPGDSAGKYVQLSQTLSGRTGSGSCVGPIAAATSAPTITGAAGANGVKGQAFSYTPDSLAGQPAPTVTVVGTLPTGVSVNSSTGELSGTPSVAGTFPVTLRADNGIGSAATLSVTIRLDDVVTGLSPTIVGTPKVGVLLMVMPGSSLSPSPGDASVTALWQYESSPGNWSDLTTGPTYTPNAAEVGRVYRAKVTVSKYGFQTRTEYSPKTAAVAKGTFTIAAPTITGTAKVGQTLTCARASGTPGTVTYTWSRGGTPVGSGATYVLTPEDRTHEVTCTATSAQIGYDDAINDADSATVDYGTFTIAAPSITGTSQVGQTLTCVAASGTPGSATYAWSRGATSLGSGASYELAAADRGEQVTCTVTSARPGYTAASNSKDSATVGSGTFTIDSPSVTGTAKVGETLTCTAAAGTPGTLSYAWTRGATPLGSGATYELAPADRTNQVTCTVTAARAGYTDATNTKDSATVATGTFSIGAPSISGTAKVGETLTCTAAAGTPGTLSYAWTRGSTALAAGASYELTADDRTEQVTCTVTAARAGYTDASNEVDSATVGTGSFTIAAPSITGSAKVGETLTCAAGAGTPGTISYAWSRGATPLGSGATYELTADDRTNTVTCTVTAVRAGYDDATNTKDSATVEFGTFTIGAPSVSGTAKVGQTLTCEAAAGTPGTVSYAWIRGITPLASGDTYELTADDRTNQVTCVVTSERAGYADAVNTAVSETVDYGTFTIDAPSISGTAKVGQSLTCEAAPGTPGTVSYAWSRGATPVGSGATYELTADDRTETVTCAATAARAGYTDATNTVDSETVDFGTFEIAAPSISGTARVGQTLTCTTAPGTPGTLTYAWTRGTTELASGATYKLTASDRTHQVTCTVTAAQAGYLDATNQATSGVVGAAAIVKVTGLKPKVVGKVTEGSKVTADAGKVVPSSAVLTYQWLVEGKKIKGANGHTFKLGKAQAGREVSVRVTATAGAVRAVATSPERMVSSKVKRLVIVGSTARGEKITVTATGLKPGRKYAIWLGGQKRATGVVGATGTVSRTLTFGSKIEPGTRRVRVSTYEKSGKRATTIMRTVHYK